MRKTRPSKVSMTRAARRAGEAGLLSVVLTVFWVACVASFRVHELVLGAPAVAVSVGFAFFAIRKLPIRFRPGVRDVAEAVRLPGNVVVDLRRVLWVLALDLTGRRAAALFRAAAWRANGDDARDLARRVLAVAYGSASPNCVVVGIDRERQQILIHQLKKAPLTAMMRRLGAGEAR